ncbi:MAG: MarR family transcriptional regulator [Bacteroidales bacterium]|nr:MarR family transcriptional regulator [Bacteroidales bacterium]
MDNLKDSITYLSVLIEKAVEETINKFDFNDLTHQQLHYLRVIVRMQNPSISEIASELKLTKPTVSVLIDKLVAKGYIVRVKSDEDRRCMHLHVSEKGMQINSILEMARERLTEKVRSALSETETLILIELLKKIARIN